jgi:hypothetical protein
MNRHSERTDNQTIMVRETYREYLEWAKSLLMLAEKCSIKEWPDRTLALQKVFRLQILYNEREALRFEYLIKGDMPDIMTRKSLTRINERLIKEWTEAEEAGLRESNSTYRDLLRGIADLEGKADSPALDEPFQTLTQNSDYRSARLAFANRIQELNEQLSRG